MSKLMMLVAAKWREFSEINPHTQAENEQTPPEPEYNNKPSRSRTPKETSKVITKKMISKNVSILILYIYIFSRLNQKYLTKKKKTTMKMNERKTKRNVAHEARKQIKKSQQKCQRLKLKLVNENAAVR